jgi:hypothetical protein
VNWRPTALVVEIHATDRRIAKIVPVVACDEAFSTGDGLMAVTTLIESRHIGSFTATDRNGHRHTLDIFQEFRHEGTALIAGIRSIRTWDGRKVNRLGNGDYQREFGKLGGLRSLGLPFL